MMMLGENNTTDEVNLDPGDFSDIDASSRSSSPSLSAETVGHKAFSNELKANDHMKTQEDIESGVEKVSDISSSSDSEGAVEHLNCTKNVVVKELDDKIITSMNEQYSKLEHKELIDLEEGELRSDSDDDTVNAPEEVNISDSHTAPYSKIISLKTERPLYQAVRASERSPNAGVCRFFLRDLCTWGERCKYFHPSESEVSHYSERKRYQRNPSFVGASSSTVRTNYTSQSNDTTSKPVPLCSVNVGNVVASDSSAYSHSSKMRHNETKECNNKTLCERNDSSSSEKHSKKSGGSTLRSLFERTDLDFSNRKCIAKSKSRSASSSSESDCRNSRRDYSYKSNDKHAGHHNNNRRHVDVEKFFKVNEEDAPAAYRRSKEENMRKNTDRMRRDVSCLSSSSSLSSLHSNCSSKSRHYKRRRRSSRGSSAISKNRDHVVSLKRSPQRRKSTALELPPSSKSPVIDPISSDSGDDLRKEKNNEDSPAETSVLLSDIVDVVEKSEFASHVNNNNGSGNDEDKKRKRLELLNQLKSVEEAIAKKRKKVNGIA